MITVHILEWMSDLTDEGRYINIRDIAWQHFKPGVETQLLLCSERMGIGHKSHLVLLMKQDYGYMKVMHDKNEGKGQAASYAGQVFKCTPDSFFMMTRLGPAACTEFMEVL